MGLSGILTRPRKRTPTSQGVTLGQVIAFANQKGGVAKTTTTLNLAVAFREQGFNVLARRPRSAGQPDHEPGHGPGHGRALDVRRARPQRCPIEEVIHRTEIDIAVSSIDLAGAELALSSMIGRERALQKALLPVRSRYDYILIDTPPSLGLLTINALTASDSVIVPVQCEYLSLRGLVQLENTLSMIRENLNPTVEIRGILPTMFDGRTLHAEGGRRDAEGELRRPRLRDADPQDRPLRGGARAGQLRAQVRPGGQPPPRHTATWRRRCSMARRRASMREGPLAELFRATEAAQRQSEKRGRAGPGDHGPADARPRRDRRVAAPVEPPAPTPEPEPEAIALAEPVEPPAREVAAEQAAPAPPAPAPPAPERRPRRPRGRTGPSAPTPTRRATAS